MIFVFAGGEHPRKNEVIEYEPDWLYWLEWLSANPN